MPVRCLYARRRTKTWGGVEGEPVGLWGAKSGEGSRQSQGDPENHFEQLCSVYFLSMVFYEGTKWEGSTSEVNRLPVPESYRVGNPRQQREGSATYTYLLTLAAIQDARWGLQVARRKVKLQIVRAAGLTKD